MDKSLKSVTIRQAEQSLSVRYSGSTSVTIQFDGVYQIIASGAGGGGGGAADFSGVPGPGGGGGGGTGAVAIATHSLKVGDVVNITVGIGGSGGSSGSDGSPGSATVVSISGKPDLTAVGGGGGKCAANGALGGTRGDEFHGQNGQPGATRGWIGGAGGRGPWFCAPGGNGGGGTWRNSGSNGEYGFVIINKVG